jgi:hypothetical protein
MLTSLQAADQRVLRRVGENDSVKGGEKRPDRGTVHVFRQKCSLDGAIGSHACSLEASMRVTNDIPLSRPLPLTVCTVNSVQTLKAKEGLVVVVMTEQHTVEWCKEHLMFGNEHGVQITICANAYGSRCRGEIVDMFAMSLGDYLIIANSTFSWWSHFFRHCRDNLHRWHGVRV